MTADELLAHLAARGVEVAVEDGHLLCDGPEDALTPDLLDLIREHKPALIAAIGRDAWDRSVAETVANVLAAPPEDRRGWHREVVAWQRYLAGGGRATPSQIAYQAHDVGALRRLLGPGRCLDCGQAAGVGSDWCAGCATKPYAPSERGAA